MLEKRVPAPQKHQRLARRAGQGRAGQGRAGQGRAGQGRAGQGRAGQGRAGQGRAGQGSRRAGGQGRAGGQEGRAGQEGRRAGGQGRLLSHQCRSLISVLASPTTIIPRRARVTLRSISSCSARSSALLFLVILPPKLTATLSRLQSARKPKLESRHAPPRLARPHLLTALLRTVDMRTISFSLPCGILTCSWGRGGDSPGSRRRS
eukprot:762942-Hanusia_phi.AAC.2